MTEQLQTIVFRQLFFQFWLPNLQCIAKSLLVDVILFVFFCEAEVYQLVLCLFPVIFEINKLT